MASMSAERVAADCVIDLLGDCSCIVCEREREEMEAADAEAEYLAEVGANYAYSGFSASDAMQMAREDQYYRRLRRQLPEMRRQFAALRAEWAELPLCDRKRDLLDAMVSLTEQAIRAKEGRFTSTTRRDVVVALIAWRKKNPR